MPFIKIILIVVTFLTSITLSHGFHFSWNNGHHGTRGMSFGLSPQFYQFSCPQTNDIVMSVLEKAISKDMRIAASLLRLHFHDCFVQVPQVLTRFSLCVYEFTSGACHSADNELNFYSIYLFIFLISGV